MMLTDGVLLLLLLFLGFLASWGTERRGRGEKDGGQLRTLGKRCHSVMSMECLNRVEPWSFTEVCERPLRVCICTFASVCVCACGGRRRRGGVGVFLNGGVKSSV